MGGLKPSFLEFRRYMDLHNAPPQLMNLLEVIYNVLEDVYSVGSMVELQTAIDDIGTGAGTIFIEAGNYTVSTTIDIDIGGTVIITGHGDNSILTTSGDISLFNITSVRSCTLKNFKVDASSVTTQTREIISITETSDNEVYIDNITIVGTNAKGYGIAINSQNCTIKDCNLGNDLRAGVYVASDYAIIVQNVVHNNTNSYGIRLDGASYCIIQQNRVHHTYHAISLGGACVNCSIIGNIVHDNAGCGIDCYQGNYHIIEGNIVYDNNSDGTPASGINLNQTNSCSIVGNSVKGNAGGIYLSSGGNHSVQSNIVIGNDVNNAGSQFGGIRLNGSHFNNVQSNTVKDNNNIGVGDMAGLYIDIATNDNIVIGNTLSGNDIPLVDNGTDNTVGWTGWFDDNVNFRVTVVDGIITAVDNSTGGGHNP